MIKVTAGDWINFAAQYQGRCARAGQNMDAAVGTVLWVYWMFMSGHKGGTKG